MDRMYYLEVTTPAGTQQNALLSTPWILEEARLVSIDVLVPDGPSGLLGFRILWAQQQIVPWGNNSFLKPNNEKIHVPVNDDITISGLVIQTFNLDVFPHTINLRGIITDIPAAQQQQVTALTGSVSVPGSQVASDQLPSIDTLTAPFPADNTGITGPGGPADTGIPGIDNSGAIDGQIAPLETFEESTPVPAGTQIPDTIPSSITLTGPPLPETTTPVLPATAVIQPQITRIPILPGSVT